MLHVPSVFFSGRPGRTERATFGGRRRFGGCALHCRGGAVDTRNCRCIRRF
ncbi:hypothetical protein IscW_ISCW014878 [Ixodes scapularis]|uniref:Uncharacterized protein n=1 Tax=Ixodes scapularis TaxID=6945 RepID=B7QI76_IXOSC|nr:hypothetical protein IscW_ISCW014878 [Ixodes scapularis]|eukprot:XP_002414883.1 hypothetical protein IscW_ISCW014878 [Ixodes scapularis]